MVSDSANLIALPPGFRLGEYRIERYLGSGGFGITYAAIDENLNRRVAIKEYLPKALAMRAADARVTFATVEDEDDFRWGLDRFLDEARALARFDHPNIVSVERFIEAHGTGYIVMEHVDGESLSELLKRKPTLTEAEIRENVLPVAAGLDEVHRAGLLHRDIKPGNIVVRANGVPVLIDFGSARHETSAKSQSLTAVITPGYAPLEQYSSSLGDERPSTDIYAFGAVLYRCVTGDRPPEATDRALEDRLTPAAEAVDGIYSPGLLTGIDAALRMGADERPRDVAAFLQLVSTGDIRPDRPEGSGAAYSETGQAVGVRPGTGRTALDAARSSEAGSSANRAPWEHDRRIEGSAWVLATIIALTLGGLVFAVFRDLDGGERAASDWRPVPAGTSEQPSIDDLPRSVLPVPEHELVASPPLSSFTVEVDPPHARVRVMNIVPLYEPGIMLAAGSYTVKVSAAGFETVTEVVRHDVEPLVGADRLGYTPTVHRVELQLSLEQLAINATTTGELEWGDLEFDEARPLWPAPWGRFADLWRVQVPAGRAGRTLTVDMVSSDFDAVLTLSSAQGSEFVSADTAGGDSGIDTAAHVSLDLPQQGGEYIVDVYGGVGAYELRVVVSSPGPSSSPAAIEEDSVRSPTFTRGSHEDDVLRLQGTPTGVRVYTESETWSYGLSTVEISTRSRRVTEWFNLSGNLKVRMEPGPNVSSSVAFTRGSPEDDVLRLQGTPTGVRVYEESETWSYGLSTVEISTRTRRVTEWSNLSGNLQVR